MLVSHLVVGLIISLYFFPYVIRKPLSWIISTISTLSKFKTLHTLLYLIKKTQKRPARIKTTKRKGSTTNPSRLVGAKVLKLQLWVSWGHRLRGQLPFLVGENDQQPCDVWNFLGLLLNVDYLIDVIRIVILALII